jgi:uncharacterized protein
LTMKILITGSSGLIGSALVALLTSQGQSVTRLVRSRARSGEGEISWDPSAGNIHAPSLEGFEAVVHLAGENIAAGRWTAEQKARIRDSRVKGTRLLAESLARLARRPAVLLCASALGYYGNRGEEVLQESSPSGSGFLAEVCRDWEAAAEPAARCGIRVGNLRMGVVLSLEGGALPRMLPPFRLGLGGRVGEGKQYMSWIAIDDVVGAFSFALKSAALCGPVNVVAPNPVTNLEFTKTLGRVLGRPTLFPMPAFAARLAFGEMADALLLGSARLEPAKLLATGFKFRFTELEPALRHILGKE